MDMVISCWGDEVKQTSGICMPDGLDTLVDGDWIQSLDSGRGYWVR
jgi:hypothetical protein